MSLIRRLFLALCLVVAQAGALAHAIGHLADHDHDGHDSPVCEQCLAYGHLGTALPAAAPAGAVPPPLIPAAEPARLRAEFNQKINELQAHYETRLKELEARLAQAAPLPPGGGGAGAEGASRPADAGFNPTSPSHCKAATRRERAANATSPASWPAATTTAANAASTSTTAS